MLAAEEGDDDDADRDYGAFMGDYNEVVPANEASRRPPSNPTTEARDRDV